MSRNGSARRAPSGPTTRISPSCSLTNSRLLPSPDRVTLMGLLRPLAKASRVRWSGSPGRVDAVAAAVGEGDGGGVVAADARWLPLASGVAEEAARQSRHRDGANGRRAVDIPPDAAAVPADQPESRDHATYEPGPDAVGTRRTIVIERVSPEIDGGRHAVKRVIGDELLVTADIYADGHDLLDAVLQIRADDEAAWRETP